MPTQQRMSKKVSLSPAGSVLQQVYFKHCKAGSRKAICLMEVARTRCTTSTCSRRSGVFCGESRDSFLPKCEFVGKTQRNRTKLLDTPDRCEKGMNAIRKYAARREGATLPAADTGCHLTSILSNRSTKHLHCRSSPPSSRRLLVLFRKTGSPTHQLAAAGCPWAPLNARSI